MEYIIKFMYGFILPPGFFVTLSLILFAVLRKQNRRLSRLFAGMALLLYLAFIPLTGELLVRPLEQHDQPPTHLSGDVLVMLGAGATSDTPDIDGKGQLSGFAANRLLTIVRLQRQTGLPVILSGGKVYSDSGVEARIARRQLIALGVPAKKLIVEDGSITTRTNALNTKKILRHYHYRRPILVTSAFHMPRAVRNFSKIGIHVQPYPTDYLVDRQQAVYPAKFVPTDGSVLFIAIKEYVGLLATLL
ncbi:MAG: YdcF family protein [Sporolactobacillus sp.]|jgi:uncharacterized SAM-binding protein YcdF (DUF218 family)|nr:YdcF family protein [Sporolactobacillus sp.]